MASLSNTKIKDTYQSLVKFSDNGNITIGAKRLTDGFGNNSPLYVSTTQIGIGITPQSGYGLHVSSDVKIGSNLEVSGNLTVNGTLTYLNVVDLEVDDPLIQLAVNNAANILDIGLFGKYVSSGTKYKGLFNDASDDKFKLFTGLTTKPLTTVDTSDSGYTVATLVANLEGDVTGNADTATNVAYTGLTGTVPTWNQNTTGNAATSSKISSITNSNIVQLTTEQTLTNKTLTSPTITGTGAIAGAFTGDLTGDVTGDITGNVTGNLTGDVTGDVTGGLTGNVIGNVTGNLTGNVTGDVTGNAYLNTIAYQGGEGSKLDNSAFNVDGIGTTFRWIESNSGATGTTWKKVADIIITGTITPNGVQMEAKVYQPNTNSGVTAGLNTVYYSIAFRGRIDDSSTHNDAIVYGQDANLLRVYKTADYTFELQARSNDDNRDLVVECNITSKKGGKVTPTTTYTDGTATGGTAYTASGNALNKTKFAGNVEFDGAIFDSAEVEDLRVNEYLYLGAQASTTYGPYLIHSNSGGTGFGVRLVVRSDLQVWGVTGNAGEQHQGLYVAGGVAKLYDLNGVVLETVLGGVDVTGDLDITGLISNSYSGTSAHILQNSTSNGTVLQLNCTGDNSSLYLEGDHIYASGALVFGNASSGANYYRATLHDFESGTVKITTIDNATTDTDKFLVSDSGEIKYRTGAEVASDIIATLDGVYVKYNGTTQSTASSVTIKLKNTVTTAAGYNEMQLLNDNDDKIIVGSIGSGYTGTDWIGATYVYNTGTGRKMYIKSQDELRFLSGGTSITANTALVLDTSQNAIFPGSISTLEITATSTNPSKFTTGGIRIKYLAIYDGTATQTGGLYMEKTITGAGTSTNTVLFAESGNDIQFATNGSASPKMVIDTDGDVGIGKTNPDAPLVVYRTGDVWHSVIGNDTGQLRIGGQTSSGAVIQSRNQGGTARDLYLQRDGGRVGIGTNNPNALLSLGSTGGQKLYVYEAGVIRSGFGIDLSGSSRELSIFTSSSNGTTGNISFGYRLETDGSYVEKMRINSSGELNVKGNLMLSVASSFIKTTSGDLYLSPASFNTTLYNGANPQVFNIYDGTSLSIKLDSASGTYGGVLLNLAGTNFVHGASGQGLVLSHHNVGASNAIISGDASNPDTLFINNGGTANDWSNVVIYGNVGVGDTSPDYRLTVKKTSIAAPAFMVSGAYYGGPRIQTYGLDADPNAWMGLGTDMSGGSYEHSIYFSDTGSLGRLSIGTYNGTTYSEKMCVLRTGNVGINETNPGEKLSVKDNGNVGISIADGSHTQYVTSIKSANAYGNGSLVGQLYLRGYNGIGFTANSGTATHVTIKSNGYVGMGTNNPVYPLEINTSVGGGGMLSLMSTAAESSISYRVSSSSANTGWVTGNYSGDFFMYSYTKGSQVMTLKPTGNVGISTTDPKTLLHIGPLSGGNGTAQERLRLSGSYNGTNSGVLLRFTNQHSSGSNPNSGEYNLAGITGFDFRSDWGGALALQTAPNNSTGGTLVNRLVINPEGLVGIGTNDPSVNLQVEGAFRVNTDANSQLNIKDAGTNAIFLAAASGDELYIGPNNVYNLRLKVDGNVVMDNGGSFGIGTGTPNALLSLGPAGGQKMYVYEGGAVRAGFGVDLSGSSRELSVFHSSSNASNGNTSFGYRLESTGAYVERMRVTGAGAVNIGTTATYSGVRLNVEGEAMGVRTSNSSWGQMYVANPNDGEVGITWGAGGTGRPGITSTYTRQWIMGLNPFGTSVTKFSLTNKTFAANPAWTCTDTGLMGIRKVSPSYALDVTGTIRASADIIAYSDRRVKENIVTIDNALNKVTKLRGVTYTRKDIEDKSTKIGVIAQEVLEVLPEVVSQDDEGKYSVAYGNMAGVFIEAIKELENRIKELENKSCNCK